jgi:hypothetical protein
VVEIERRACKQLSPLRRHLRKGLPCLAAIEPGGGVILANLERVLRTEKIRGACARLRILRHELIKLVA